MKINNLKGLKVIGVTGSDEKAKWLRDELNFDHVINYKTSNFNDELKKIAPDGIDIYFDNVIIILYILKSYCDQLYFMRELFKKGRR